MIRSVTHKPPYIFLKIATRPTYYGISIAIPRYIAMQLSTIPFIMTRSMVTHKYTGSIVVLSISKSVEPNEEQKEMISGFQQGILCKY